MSDSFLSDLRALIDVDASVGTRARYSSDAGLTRIPPLAVAFPRTPEQAAAMAAVSDGAIVGSAIVTLAGRYGRDAVPAVRDYVQAMKAAVSAPQRPAEADPP